MEVNQYIEKTEQIDKEFHHIPSSCTIYLYISLLSFPGKLLHNGVTAGINKN